MNIVKENLKIFIPALIEFISDNDFPWDKIDNLFSELIKTRTAKCNGMTILIEASIYDIIVAAKKNDSTAIGLLHFFNKLFEELTDNLNLSEKLLVKSNVKQMLTALDSKYLNFLGEIATLNNIIKSKTYRLESIEEKIPNGKSIDFKFRIIEKGTFILVEIVNIHLETNRVEANPELITKYLTNKLTQKIESKKKGLTTDIPFYLIPVIWGASADIKIYSDFFKSNKLEIENLVEPVSYLTYTNHKGYYEHHFKTISNLFQ